jgi:predicted transcriptional regulator
MDLSNLKSSLFGYSKLAVSNYVSNLESEYNQKVQDAQKENKILRLKLAEAKKTQKVEHIQTIEIIDNRKPNEVKFGGF